jgi:N-acetyl-D-muramate 6-phosphate phosphatase
VSGDTCAHAKPHPAPVLHACEIAGTQVENCLYVGDAERDVQAANAAGMPALVALYGYLGEDDSPLEWGARVTSAAGRVAGLGCQRRSGTN